VLADELGYFRDAGLNVTISLPGNTDRMLAEFAADQQDLIAVALGDLINLTRNRDGVLLLLVSDESAGGDAVLQRAGAALDQPGLKVGTNLGGFGELFVREFLSRRGIDANSVQWTNIDASAVPAALAAGDIDLGHCWEPYVSEAEAGGALKLFSSADTPGLIPDVIATSREMAERRGDDLRAFNGAWFRALDWWRATPVDGNRRIEQRLKLEPGSLSLRGIRLLDLADNRRALGAAGPPGLEAVIDRYSAFFVSRGSLTRPVQAAQMMDPRLLP
jgi:NitT/TauT family transport system substrate-binding protein